MFLLLASSCFILGELSKEPNEFLLGSQGFSASVWPLFDIAVRFGNQICPTPLPSHSQANDGVKTLRLIEVSLRASWCFY